nr:hypothetical protein HAGR004_37450 [Bdellovibrio sp. HAGR004]
MKEVLFISLVIFQACFAQAGEPKSWAKDIISHRLNMKPKTEFEKWNADQWTNAAVTCAFYAKMETPKEINKLPNLKSGSFSLPDNEETFCKALAKGPSPQCFYLKATTSPFESPPVGLPSNYVYMKKLVPENTQVTAGGECNLVTNEFSTKQYFTGNAKVVWRSKPKLQSIQTFSGAKQVNMGTIWFDVEGMPGKEQMPSTSAVVTDSL